MIKYFLIIFHFTLSSFFFLILIYINTYSFYKYIYNFFSKSFLFQPSIQINFSEWYVQIIFFDVVQTVLTSNEQLHSGANKVMDQIQREYYIYNTIIQ